jgi:hypothetical protein
MWGDMMWMSRFDGGDGPTRPLTETGRPMAGRPSDGRASALDARIAGWTWMVSQEELDGRSDLVFGRLGRDMSKPVRDVRRAFLQPPDAPSRAGPRDADGGGAKTDDTDLPFMPDEVPEWN